MPIVPLRLCSAIPGRKLIAGGWMPMGKKPIADSSPRHGRCYSILQIVFRAWIPFRGAVGPLHPVEVRTILRTKREGRMTGKGADASIAASMDSLWESFRVLIRVLEDERDLQGLASVAETSLVGLRQLCERPVTCEQLDEMLAQLRGLKLDPWELGEE